VEFLIGHNECNVIIETSENIYYDEVLGIVNRIAGNVALNINVVAQDTHLANNQSKSIKCGDNGIFKGVPLTYEEIHLGQIARTIYNITRTDGKYILNDDRLIICQSNIETKTAYDLYDQYFDKFGCDYLVINPLGDWTGGINVDSGATNRKLGSDMAQSVTGGGLHGKDLSKADVSVNIYAFLKAQETGKPVELCCAIGDEFVDDKPYNEIVEIAKNYINSVGGFEKFAEWGLY
jgi:S-adenosylmethionine synthetase